MSGGLRHRKLEATFRVQVFICATAFLINNILIFFDVFSRANYSWKLQLGIFVFIIGNYAIFNAKDALWFGDSFEEGHSVNVFVSKLFATIVMWPPVLYSLNALVQFVGHK